MRYVGFFDATFNIRRERTFEICEELLKRNLNKLTWFANIRGDRMDEASRIFNRALNIREFLFEVFSLLAHGKKPDDTHLTHLNTLISDALRHIRLKYSRGKFIEEWEFDTTNLELILWPIIKSSSELLLSGRFDRIKECPRCRWLFYDTSKNGKRRWCSMETCGSNDKALRYYYRKSKQGNK